ncbi:MAG: protein kinase, partial [Capsulimonadales bacterium]|nr:protein kinase [Capsulimonadales bacterium]
EDDTQTSEGTIQGTPHYMAPEQAAGEQSDARADIFAFGAVFYELLTGNKAFQGSNPASIISAVLKDDPLTLGPLPATVPPATTKLLSRCFSKDRERRYQSARDVALDLEEVDFPPPVPVSSSRRNLIFGTVSAFAAGIGLEHLRNSRPEGKLAPDSVFLTIHPPEGHRATGLTGISPDGKFVVFSSIDGSAKTHRWVQSLNQPTPRLLATHGLGLQGWRVTTWSPDSRFLAINIDTHLFRFDLGSGTFEKIAEISPATSLVWLDSGVILISSGRRSFRVAASGGIPEPLAINGRTLRYLPGGSHFLFDYFEAGNPLNQHVGTIDGKDLGRVLENVRIARYGGGYLFYLTAEGRLHARAYDVFRNALTGQPVQVTDAEIGTFTVSQNRSICFSSGAQGGSASRIVGRDGAERFTFPGPSLGHPEYSADGKRILAETTTGDIWIFDRERETRVRLTYDGGGVPVWSHDESSIFYSGGPGSDPGIYRIPSSGGGKPERILSGRTHHIHASPDGAFIAATLPEGSGLQLVAIPLKGDRKPRVLTSKPFFIDQPQFSPDSKWLAYASDETGRSEIYLMAFPSG